MADLNQIKVKAKKRIEEIHRQAGIEFNISSISEKQYNYEFDLFRDDQRVKLLVYFGRKGVRELVQGNKNLALYSQAEELLTSQTALNFAEGGEAEHEKYIGSDESGKGDFFGPLVVAAFAISPEVKSLIPLHQIRDSKELSDDQIFTIAQKIKSAVPQSFEIVSYPPEIYNEKYDSYGNLNMLLEEMHFRAISKLHERIGTKKIIIDKFTPKRLQKFDSLLNIGAEISTIEKAEKFTAVACASILARDEFNAWFSSAEQLGVYLPKGSSNGIEKAAEEYFSGSENAIGKFAKLHFKTAKKLNLF